jgi:hypothetical protein
MEDYQAAFLDRQIDTETLDPSENSQANTCKDLRPVLADSVSTLKSGFDTVTDSLEREDT